MAVDFCDYFWGEEHNGWNVLYQNMKQGHSASKELADFFKERWIIDENYCKSLLKLANKASINSEKGTLAPLFSLLKISSEKMSNVHLHMVNRIQDLLKDIGKYNDELHKKHKMVKDEESQTEDVVKNIQATSTLVQKAKEIYTQRSQDLEKVRRDGASPKDVEKAETKLRKAHDEYKVLVEKYNVTRDEFEKRMTHSCKKFQGVEETHLSQILFFIKTSIYLLQKDHQDMGKILQELMSKYSQFSIDKLLDTFALSKLTGLEKPVMMVFEDNNSLGSAISGQQSPEPVTGGGDEANTLDKGSGGVLTGGRDLEVTKEGVCGVAKKELKSVRSSIFSKSKVSRGMSKNSPQAESDSGENGPHAFVSSRPVTYRRPDPVKSKHRTTSLLNIFVASSFSNAKNVSSKVEEVCSEGEIDVSNVATSPAKVISAPSSPTAEDPTLTRSVFRSSKWFLRSRRNKKKEIKAKKKKEVDSSSNKDDKSDNENSEEARTCDLLSLGVAPPIPPKEEEPPADLLEDPPEEIPIEASSVNISIPEEEPKVDEEGFTIKPAQNPNKIASFDSDSDSDSAEIGIEKKIHVEIKPISNGTPPMSASVDELRATVESWNLSPPTVCQRKNTSENLESVSMRRSNSTTQQMGSSSADLVGLNLNCSPRSGSRDCQDELSEILGDKDADSVPPVLPPRGSISRGSTPTPAMALPRPTSRKSSGGRSVPSPATLSGLSHTESISSLEFRTWSNVPGISRGPSPLTIGMADTIPLAVAFQELCHAYFRGTDESKIQMKVTGEMMVSFPAGIVGVLANNPSPAQLSFRVDNFNSLSNPLPNRQLVTLDEAQSTETSGVYNFDMSALSTLLRKQADTNPSASYFNVDIIKYQVAGLNGASCSPLHLVSYWRCEDSHTDLRIDYRYNAKGMSSPAPLRNVNVSVPIDGLVRNMQSKPQGQWLKDQQKAVWKLPELSGQVEGGKLPELPGQVEGGKGSLRGKLEVAAGPSTPTTVTAQFNCEGATLSHLQFSLLGQGYRVSLVKKRFVAGKYICDADAVLRHRYGTVS